MTIVDKTNYGRYAARFPSFGLRELASPDTGEARFRLDFLVALQSLRVAFGAPMVLTSAARTRAHNTAIGGHPRSLHVCDWDWYPGQGGALAVDVAAVDPAYRGRLFSLAWGVGWSVGWGGRRGFLHLDKRAFVGLPQSTFDY